MEKILTILKEKKKLLILIIFLLVIIFSGALYLKYYQKQFNIDVSEKYIKAGIYLTTNNNKDSKKFFKEIVESKHFFYSVLALNSIIENNLEENNKEIFRLFKIVEESSKTEEQKNHLKFKKALYYIKILKESEGNILLNEIIKSNSIWKEAAKETLNLNQ